MFRLSMENVVISVGMGALAGIFVFGLFRIGDKPITVNQAAGECKCVCPQVEDDISYPRASTEYRADCIQWKYDARAYHEAVTILQDRVDSCARQACDLLSEDWPESEAWNECVDSYNR